MWHCKTIALIALLLVLVPDWGIAQSKKNKEAEKINGMCFSAPQSPGMEAAVFNNIKNSHANWVAIVPEATMNRSTLQLRPDHENDDWGETIEASIQGTQLAKDAGFKVMLKPHIVLGEIPSRRNGLKNTFMTLNNIQPVRDKTRGAKWRGTFAAANEADWQIWENSYQNYILRLAEIADSMQVDLFCIGTELKRFATKRVPFWKQLIQEVRAIYRGSLTYSANWDEYMHIDFWEELDYIGVDTYFPINSAKMPSIKKTLRNWQSIQKKMKRLSRKKGRQVLITEFGYRNIYYAGRRPWIHDDGTDQPYYQGQVNLYSAFFQAFWDKNWVAGGFSWKWFYQPASPDNTTFSIQNKPALMVLQKWYSDK